MQEENCHLSLERERHLAIHGVNPNEDGSYSWKFDNYVRRWPADVMPTKDVQLRWSQNTCPTLLVYGNESFTSNPREDSRAEQCSNAVVVTFDKAGHWVHHHPFDGRMSRAGPFSA